MKGTDTRLFALPVVGTRFAFERGSERRVYELVASIAPEAALAVGRSACDRHTLRVVEETGYAPENAAGLGHEMHVEDAWFERRDFKILPAAAVKS